MWIKLYYDKTEDIIGAPDGEEITLEVNGRTHIGNKFADGIDCTDGYFFSWDDLDGSRNWSACTLYNMPDGMYEMMKKLRKDWETENRISQWADGSRFTPQ